MSIFLSIFTGELYTSPEYFMLKCKNIVKYLFILYNKKVNKLLTKEREYD